MSVTFDKLLSKPLLHKHKTGDITGLDTTFLKLDQTTPQTVINAAPTFDRGLYSNDIIRAIVDGSDAVQIQSSADDDYSKLSFGVFTDPEHTNEYTYIQSVKGGEGTLLPISFWVGSGVGAIRAWDISTTGDLLAGGDGMGAQNITTAGTGTFGFTNTFQAGDAGISGSSFVALGSAKIDSGDLWLTDNPSHVYFGNNGSGITRWQVGGSVGFDISANTTDAGNFTINIPSNDGTNKLILTDVDDVEQFAVDSNGNLTLNGTVDGVDIAAIPSTYLKLNQSTPQTLTTSPIFDNLTAGRIPFASATKTLTDDSGLFWDNTNKRLGIGTTEPSQLLEVRKDQNAQTQITITNQAALGNTNAAAVVYLTANDSDGYFGAFPSDFGLDSKARKRFQIGSGPNATGLNFYANYADQDMRFYTGGSERMRILTGGNVGIGITNPGSRLVVKGSGTTSATSALKVTNSSDVSALFVRDDGRVGIGTTSPLVKLHLQDSTQSLEYSDSLTSSGAAYGSAYIFRRSNGTPSSKTIVASGDALGYFGAYGYDGANFKPAAQVAFYVDGTPGTNDMPGRIEFQATPDGSASPVTALTIKNSGNVGIGTTSPAQKLHVAGIELITDKLAFTQTDLNEYIDSGSDGWVNIGATTGVEINAPILNVTSIYSIDGFDCGDAGGFSGMKFNASTTQLEVWIDGAKIGHFAADGTYTDDV